MNKKDIREIVRYARLKGLDEIEEIQSCLAEKDSRLSRREVQRIIAQNDWEYGKREKEQKT